MNKKSENQEKPIDIDIEINIESGEERLAKHGFFLNEELQGDSEGDQLAGQLADLFKSMQEGLPFDPAKGKS